MRKQGLATRHFFIERVEITDKSYSGDNRLVSSESPYRRRSSAPRCRLTTSRGWRSSQGFGCSPIKVVRELGSNRQRRTHREKNLDSMVFLSSERRLCAARRKEKSTHIGETRMHLRSTDARVIPRELRRYVGARRDLFRFCGTECEFLFMLTRRSPLTVWDLS